MHTAAPGAYKRPACWPQGSVDWASVSSFHTALRPASEAESADSTDGTDRWRIGLGGAAGAGGRRGTSRPGISLASGTRASGARCGSSPVRLAEIDQLEADKQFLIPSVV